MGLNFAPAPTTTGFDYRTQGLQPNNFPTWGPAPSASASPTVPTVGIPSTSSPGLVPSNVSDLIGAHQGIDTVPQTGGGLLGGLNWNMDTTKAVLGGVGMLGQIWSAYQANKIARDSLDFQKKAYKENVANQRSSYNTALEDRAYARYAQMGRPNDAADYIAKHRLGG